ncbi:MBL fold metallo-hydrolase [Salinarchaeum sp. IM2453]|uniref:MBL fold metallo-hydrolase n=1 Tax=Salinarchaeum sp. IM2453 TaxID=2862870 RepID=UPI001C82F8B2|nr:MBL fold metallo-hydrolase [Salinarchaeum sp. IM2453]QZA87532.1 MBL fold metallo-hydrolase [Salinarchaeum sp. IM2453]
MEVYNVTAEAETFTSNVFLVPGETTALVDTGAMDDVTSVISDYVDVVDAVYITHQHSDHIDQLDNIIERFAPTVATFEDHEHQTKTLDDGDHVQLGDDTYEVVHSPGHADDHVALIGPNRIFSGDVVVYNDSAFGDGSFGRTDLPGQSRDQLIHSLETILDRLPDTVRHMHPGHGDSYEGDVRSVIERALRRARRKEPKYSDN